MEYLVIAACTTGLLVIVVILARNALRRNWDLLSWRNLLLVGYAHFVLLSGYFTVSEGHGPISQGAVTDWAMALYAVLAVVFLIVFLAFSALARRVGVFHRLIPRLELPVTTPAILCSIVTLLTFGAVGAVVPLPAYLKVLTAQFTAGLAVTAVGLATYWWLSHKFNPVSWGLLLGTMGLSVVLCTAGGIGRRDAVAVLVAVPWVWYFASLRYRSAASMAIPVSVLAVAGVLFIAAFTVIRHKGVSDKKSPGVEERLQQFTQMATNPAISEGAVNNMLYTDTAGNTMFIFNTYPSNHAFEPFRGLKWMLVNPIPRSVYPDKPDAFGIKLQKQMNVGANLGPGILGQAWSEGGVIAVLAFAGFFGVLYGAFDRALLERAWNPFFVSVAGAGAGNVLAMPRGDVALFLIQILAAMISAAIVLSVLRVVIGPIARAFPVLTVGPVPAGETVEAGEWEEDGAHRLGGGEDAAPRYALVLPTDPAQ
jgi:hypothetical protein